MKTCLLVACPLPTNLGLPGCRGDSGGAVSSSTTAAQGGIDPASATTSRAPAPSVNPVIQPISCTADNGAVRQTYLTSANGDQAPRPTSKAAQSP